MPQDLPPRLPAVTAATLAYSFLIREFSQLVGLLVVPSVATALVLYLSLKAYLAQLIAFISSGDPRAASLALGALAAGVFLSIFFAAIAIASVTDLALFNQRDRRWVHIRAGRKEWRLYAAYLRFFLVAAGFIATVYLISAFVLPQLAISAVAIGAVSAFLMIAGWYWLFARLGFLIAPIVAQSTGTVLRKALHEGSGDLPRNLSLLVLLSLPGFVIEIAGEYLFKMGSVPARVELTLPIVYYARALDNRLAEFVFLSSLSAFLTLVLFTAASLICYRDRVFGDADISIAQVAKLDSARV
jgi:hypothetical protein